MMQFIQDSCDIILHKNSETTIILGFKVKNVVEMNYLYAQNYDKYKESLESTYLIQSNDNSKKYNYQTETTKKKVSLLQNFLQNAEKRNIMISLLLTNFDDIKSSKYDKFFEENLGFFSENNEVLNHIK